MGTAGGEPRVLLNALKPMLGVVGDIKTPQEVLRVVGMMKDAEKLMSRCVYLNILKATCRQAKQNQDKKETLEKFLATGGWGILNKWLHEFTKSENFPVLLELIDVLKILPITVDLLKQGNTGKLIKQMTKLEHPDVKKNATGLIRQWKDMIRGGSDKKHGGENENGESVEGSSNKRLLEPEDKGPPEKRVKVKTLDASKQVSDSSGFMNALNAAAPAAIKKKRRNSNSKTTLPLDEILNKSVSDKRQKLEAEGDSVPVVESPTETEIPIDDENSVFALGPSPAVEIANQKLAEDTDTTVLVDEGSLARKKKKKKRNITWAAEEQLVQIKYFELLEGERKGHHVENFSQARQHELMLEKQAMRAARRGEDKMVERLRWGRLIPVDSAGVPNFMPGEKSREKYLQAEREKSVLAFIFLTKESLPDNPMEPDFDPEEHSNRSQPRTIPHDEDGTVFPVPKSNNQNQQSSKGSQQPAVPEDNFPLLPSPMSANPPGKVKNNKGDYPEDVSPAVQTIMSQLLGNNNNQFLQGNEQSNNAISAVVSNMASSLLGQPGSVKNNLPPPPPNHPPGKNQHGPNSGKKQHGPNSGNGLLQNPDEIPSIMQNPIPNPRGRGNDNGPRFQGGRGGPMNRGRGGFNRGGHGPRQRWDGPPQGPNYNDDWDNYNENNYDGYNEYNENYNDNYNDNYRGGPNNRGEGNFGSGRNDGYNENYANSGRGFRRGGNNRGRGGNERGRGGKERGRGGNERGRGGNERGRGGNERGRGGNERGRGGNERGRGGNERGRGGNERGRGRDRNQDSGRGNDGPRDRREGNDRNFGSGSNRGRDRGNSGPVGGRNRDDREKGVCQHFLSPRGCRNGDRCKYLHAQR